MGKFYKKTIFIALIFIAIISIITTTYAISTPENYMVGVGDAPSAGSRFSNILNTVLGIITTVGIIVAVGGIMIIGIQTMTASAQEKAVYKQKIIPFIIGFVVLVASRTIVFIVSEINW